MEIAFCFGAWSTIEPITSAYQITAEWKTGMERLFMLSLMVQERSPHRPPKTALQAQVRNVTDPSRPGSRRAYSGSLSKKTITVCSTHSDPSSNQICSSRLGGFDICVSLRSRVPKIVSFNFCSPNPVMLVTRIDRRSVVVVDDLELCLVFAAYKVSQSEQRSPSKEERNGRMVFTSRALARSRRGHNPFHPS